MTVADASTARYTASADGMASRAGWRGKVLAVDPAEPSAENGDYLTYMRTVRVNLPAMHGYAKAVAGALHEWLAGQTAADLERKVNTPVGEHSVAQALIVFVIWHLDAHCGEIAALKGCLGAKGYPF